MTSGTGHSATRERYWCTPVPHRTPPWALRDGDFLLCVVGSQGQGPPELQLRWWWAQTPHQCPLTPGSWPPRVTMEWLQRVQTAAAPDLGSVLRQCLAVTERGVARLAWPDPLPYHPPAPYPAPAASTPVSSRYPPPLPRYDTPSSDPSTPTSNTSPTSTPSTTTPTPSCEPSPPLGRVPCEDAGGQVCSPWTRDSYHGKDSRSGRDSHLEQDSQVVRKRAVTPSASSEYSDCQDHDPETFHDARGLPQDALSSPAMTDSATSAHSTGSSTGTNSGTTYGSSSGTPSGTAAGTPGTGADSVDAVRVRRISNTSGYYTSRVIETPASVLEADYDLLQSGVAVLPGSRDVEGRALVFLFAGSSLWHSRQVSSSHLTQLLLYYHSVPRHEISCQGLTIVADVRGGTCSIVNTILESLYLFDDNIPGGLAVVHLLAEKSMQSLILKSPVYHPQSSFKLDLLLSQELLHQYIQPDMLPSALDGSYHYCHEEWVRYRMKLEPFLATCRRAALCLVGVMGELSAQATLPRTATEAMTQIADHDAKVKATFNDHDLLTLQRDGETVMSSLRRGEAANKHSPDYRYAIEMVEALFQQLQDTMTRLINLADTRLDKLQKCLQLREFEEECNKLLTWLGSEGRTGLQRHREVGDNLKAVRHQQRDFDKFYFASMKHMEKGNDLLEEASMLSQSGQYEEAPGYRDLARTLKMHMQKFTTQLEETREKIEGTANVYSLLDKSYEWALQAMKYVASMKMENVATPAGLEKLLRSLDAYLISHPPLGEDQFASMLATASRLGNDKLVEQCRVAQARCQETFQLLTLRQTTLTRAKEQLCSEKQRNQDRSSEASSSDTTLVGENGEQDSFSSSSTRTCGDGALSPDSLSEGPPVWERRTGSGSELGSLSPRHDGVVLRGHRHYAASDSGRPSSSRRPEERPISTSASDSRLSALRRDGARRMASPPQSPMRSPQSPLSSNVPDLLPSPDPTSPASPTCPPVPCRAANSDQTLMSPPSSDRSSQLPISRTISQPGSTFSSHNRPIKKLLKRAVTAPIGTPIGAPIYEGQEAGGAADSRVFVSPGRQQRDSRALSMMTGSSESLPSMPEEEDEELEGGKGEGNRTGGRGHTGRSGHLCLSTRTCTSRTTPPPPA